jgi:glycosyltransferase involved in cell wall biosynthesis
VSVLVWAHEAAYSFHEPGRQRKALAVAQRAGLVSVVAAARGVVVASADRERWLDSRRWLPRRPLARIPVCGTVLPTSPAPPKPGRPVVGVLGFGADDAQADAIAGAVGVLRRRGAGVELRMLGAPGDSGRVADRWRAAVHRAGCASALSFTGIVPERELSRGICSSQIVLFPNGSGPVAGKTTIASALGHRRPVVAIDGPLRWDRLRETGALCLARPTQEDVADRLQQLLEDPAARDRQAAAGEDFYRRELSPAVCAERLLGFAGEVAR